jgi:hypothetical protein
MPTSMVETKSNNFTEQLDQSHHYSENGQGGL